MVPNERGEPQISPLFAGSEQLRSQQEKKSGGGGGGGCAVVSALPSSIASPSAM